ncbi:MAG TPA: hypothetical protein VGK53_14915 [Propionicimonas sp.]|jgi:hypothetical protein
MHNEESLPIVVRIFDDVTGALSVVTVEEASTVLDVWFPRLTPEARQTMTALRACLEAEDWQGADVFAGALGLRIEHFGPPTRLPSPRRSAEDSPGTRAD